MQNKTNKTLDDIIEKIDKKEVFEKVRKKIQVWNGEMSEKERVNELKSGSIF